MHAAATRVRRATHEDLPTLVAHRRAMWEDLGEFTKEQLDAADPVYRRWARARLRSGRLAAWIVEDPEGEPLASGCVWILRVQPNPGLPRGEVPYLLSMYTAPHARGRGLARRIVEEATAWSAARGHATMRLHASPMGRPLYESMGWERTWEMRLALPKKGA